MARFLMNAMLASGGYPWTVILVEDRTPYLTTLDSASIDADIGPFDCGARPVFDVVWQHPYVSCTRGQSLQFAFTFCACTHVGSSFLLLGSHGRPLRKKPAFYP